MTDFPVNARDLAEMLAVLPEVIVLTDTERRILYLNRSAEGYEAKETLGRDSLEFVAPEYQDAQAELFDQVLETGEPASYEIPMTDAHGETQWHEGKFIPVERDGAASAVVIVTRNVTERHRAEEEAEMLRRLVPVCSWCRKVRDEEGHWKTLEDYVEEREASPVTHGMCPECRGRVEDEGNGT